MYFREVILSHRGMDVAPVHSGDRGGRKEGCTAPVLIHSFYTLFKRVTTTNQAVVGS